MPVTNAVKPLDHTVVGDQVVISMADGSTVRISELDAYCDKILALEQTDPAEAKAMAARVHDVDVARFERVAHLFAT